jgi:hypothetical protein
VVHFEQGEIRVTVTTVLRNPSVLTRYLRAHKSPRRVRFWANRTLSRHRSWDLHSSDAAEHEYDEVGHGLKSFFTQNDGRAAALITYFEPQRQRPAIVGASILMPRSVFQDTISLLKLAIGNPKIKYVIALEFYGLSDLGAPTTSTLPNIAEFVNSDFLHRRAYFSSEVSVSVSHVPDPD